MKPGHCWGVRKADADMVITSPGRAVVGQWSAVVGDEGMLNSLELLKSRQVEGLGGVSSMLRTMVLSLATTFDDLHIVAFPESFDRKAKSSYAAADNDDRYSCCFLSLHAGRVVVNDD
jgi:hypothetical protein